MYWTDPSLYGVTFPQKEYFARSGYGVPYQHFVNRQRFAPTNVFPPNFFKPSNGIIPQYPQGYDPFASWAPTDAFSSNFFNAAQGIAPLYHQGFNQPFHQQGYADQQWWPQTWAQQFPLNLPSYDSQRPMVW